MSTYLMPTAPQDSNITTQQHNSGWIKLHRSILEWEWWDHPLVFHVFLACVLSANHEDRRWRGQVIRRGEFITSRERLADLCHCTIQQLRTCLSHLEYTGEITRKSTNRSTRIVVVNYNTYQAKPETDNQQITNNQPTNNQQLTTNKNYKNDKNDKNKNTGASAFNLDSLLAGTALDNLKAKEALEEWLAYKRERGQSYKTSRGIKKLIFQFSPQGAEALRRAVDHSIQNNYSGCFAPNGNTRSTNSGSRNQDATVSAIQGIIFGEENET